MALFGEMDKMREERVTKEIIKYLNNNNWFIFSYDFPQSGTGILKKQRFNNTRYYCNQR